ncbi:Sds3p KNAG_0A05320 [Huiozyma naganishii CBS 8797]|uniref:Transcriptional regulatory protein SDS3 n=1 Tax=Huiozyma naganishii (strain ATCC MYA-139 / BCRC 22969 / CBS 8797 / KCTC 17520 / NBRC 10181 / NCYC 3082 / Yp74L-3) TaxID=1071383 RepID=J7RF58_HUIN7|nr:hypothetical protein KNAG_0A05320 [Kazachstania naganishii CBS 8797]CCK68198.1 hypothetical protein KNAG_0A05320 [Kazachstania naganishii CBS 8797]
MTSRMKEALKKDTSRKDKRRYNLENRVSKITSSFFQEKDLHYKDRLTSLQTSLTTLHQGTNPLYLRNLHDIEEERDLELVRLRLYEEYRVYRSGIEFQEDIEKAKQDHEKLVKLCKERLYFKVEQKIKKLQEERLLMDVANMHSYSMDYSRPLIYQKNTRSHTANNNGVWESSSNELNKDAGFGSATDTATGTERRSLRRRLHMQEGNKSGTDMDNAGTNGGYYSSTVNGGVATGDYTEDSDSRARYSTAGNGGTGSGSGNRGRANAGAKGSKSKLAGQNGDTQSDTEFLQGISDHADLQTLLFGEKEAKSSSSSANGGGKKKHRINPRYSTKPAPPLTSLTMDEVTEDIAVIKQLTNQPPGPFKVRTE